MIFKGVLIGLKLGEFDRMCAMQLVFPLWQKNVWVKSELRGFDSWPTICLFMLITGLEEEHEDQEVDEEDKSDDEDNVDLPLEISKSFDMGFRKVRWPTAGNTQVFWYGVKEGTLIYHWKYPGLLIWGLGRYVDLPLEISKSFDMG